MFSYIYKYIYIYIYIHNINSEQLYYLQSSEEEQHSEKHFHELE